MLTLSALPSLLEGRIQQEHEYTDATKAELMEDTNRLRVHVVECQEEAKRVKTHLDRFTEEMSAQMKRVDEQMEEIQEAMEGLRLLEERVSSAASNSRDKMLQFLTLIR